jgi:AbrB family looped-hinge helix DNA binding protein
LDGLLYFFGDSYNKVIEGDKVTMTVLTVSQKGWVVIPAELRKKYGLTPGSQVRIVDYGGVLGIVPLLDDPIHQAYGMLAGGPSLIKALLAERAEERRREDSRNR